MGAIASDFGGFSVFKYTSNLLVVIAACVALTATVACTSAWRWQDASYAAQEHRVFAGHSTGSYSGLTRVRCAVLCLRKGDARCRSFNYGETDGSCQLNGARAEEFPECLVEDLDFSYYGAELQTRKNDFPEHQKTADLEWQLVFKGMAGHAVKLYDMWTAATWDAATMGAGGSWRDDSLYGRWSSGLLSIGRVKLSVYDSKNVSRAELVFNGRYSGVISWFAKDRLISSSWLDLSSSSETNYFSIAGHVIEGLVVRRFYINSNFGGCPVDSGWLIVVDSYADAYCAFERAPTGHPYPLILYSTTSGKVVWHNILTANDVTVGRADYLTIHIDVDE